jgi:PAS domain-containing protein
MANEFLQSPHFSRLLFDAIPSPAFIVDHDVRILALNRAALPFVGDEPDKIMLKRGGDALRCIQAAHAVGGCGTGEACPACVVRNSVNKAMSGRETVRHRADMQLVSDSDTIDLHLLITVSPIEYEEERYALLILEDITELDELRQILPICSRCKRIRNDQQYWEQVEGYLSKHTHIQFSHSICPDCAHELYPDLYDPPPVE